MRSMDMECLRPRSPARTSNTWRRIPAGPPFVRKSRPSEDSRRSDGTFRGSMDDTTARGSTDAGSRHLERIRKGTKSCIECPSPTPLYPLMPCPLCPWMERYSAACPPPRELM